jgi:L-asparaginase/beta-aspartyl-peptidase (threonine type)
MGGSAATSRTGEPLFSKDEQTMEALLVGHGGVGGSLTATGAVRKAVRVGTHRLKQGASVLEAVARATVVLEDDPRFNAGTGSVYRLDGSIEMDAGVMDSSGRLGAVAAIRRVKNPILVALEIVKSPHMILAGEGAVEFARSHKFDDHDPSSEKARKRLKDMFRRLRSGKVKYYHRAWRKYRGTAFAGEQLLFRRPRFPERGASCEGRSSYDGGRMSSDTVGVVGRDFKGRFAAANSTGGISLALPGRVGDSPIFGAGLWAGPHGAVVATGIGEEIIRTLASKAIYDLMAAGCDAQKACEDMLAKTRKGFPVGFVAVGKDSYGIAATRDMPVAVCAARRETAPTTCE